MVYGSGGFIAFIQAASVATILYYNAHMVAKISLSAPLLQGSLQNTLDSSEEVTICISPDITLCG